MTYYNKNVIIFVYCMILYIQYRNMCKKYSQYSIMNRLLYIFMTCMLFCLQIYGTYALTPWDIWGQVFFLDAQNIDGDNNPANEPGDNSGVSVVVDSFSSHNANQILNSQEPLYILNTINEFPALVFDGTNDIMHITDDLDINTDAEYDQKSFALIIKTVTDINTFQTVYEQGWKEKWFSLQIEGAKLYAWIYNSFDWSAGNQLRKIDFGTIQSDTIYRIIFVYDEVGNEIRGYLDGTLITTLTSIEKQKTHGICMFNSGLGCTIYATGTSIGLWWTLNDVQKLSDGTFVEVYEDHYFGWSIGEIVQWNTALTPTQALEIDEYLYEKWYGDVIEPLVTGMNFLSNTLLPWGNHDIIFTHSDEIDGSGIDITDIKTNYYDNIAPEATITHSPSTTWWVPPHPQSIVNGIKRTDWAYNYEYHSDAGSSSFIEFSWATPHKIGDMKIYNRANSCCSGRLSNATIKLYDSSNTLLYTYTLWDTTGVNIVDIDFEALGEIHEASVLRLDVPSAINIREIEIFPYNENIIVRKWDGTQWWENIASTAITMSSKIITPTTATYSTNNLDYGKYQIGYSVRDYAGNISLLEERILYIDRPEFTISHDEFAIGTVNSVSQNFSNEITFTVKTIGAAFELLGSQNTPLSSLGYTIPYWNGTYWLWYDNSSI